MNSPNEVISNKLVVFFLIVIVSGALLLGWAVMTNPRVPYVEPPVNETETDNVTLNVTIDEATLLIGDGFYKQDAPIQILEFSDFRCGFCKKVSPIVHQLKEHYGDLVSIQFKEYPISSHARSREAALAVECARNQGKFWDYEQLLFENQTAFSDEMLKSFAVYLGLNSAQFNSCYDERQTAQRLEQHLALSREYNVTATPTFFINGKLLLGYRPFDTFADVIDANLTALGITPPARENQSGNNAFIVSTDPFGLPPKNASMNCGPEQRYSYNTTVGSKQDFIDFLKIHHETYDVNWTNSDSDFSWVRLDNFRNIDGTLNYTELDLAEINWVQVLAAINTETIGNRTVYSLNYTPRTCSLFTIKMTNDGYISIYGCCGE